MRFTFALATMATGEIRKTPTKTGILMGLLGDDSHFVRMCLENIRATHKICPSSARPLANAVVFRRPERVICTYAYILTSLGVCSLFYGKDPNSFNKKIAKQSLPLSSCSQRLQYFLECSCLYIKSNRKRIEKMKRC